MLVRVVRFCGGAHGVRARIALSCAFIARGRQATTCDRGATLTSHSTSGWRAMASSAAAGSARRRIYSASWRAYAPWVRFKDTRERTVAVCVPLVLLLQPARRGAGGGGVSGRTQAASRTGWQGSKDPPPVRLSPTSWAAGRLALKNSISKLRKACIPFGSDPRAPWKTLDCLPKRMVS